MGQGMTGGGRECDSVGWKKGKGRDGEARVEWGGYGNGNGMMWGFPFELYEAGNVNEGDGYSFTTKPTQSKTST